MKDTQIIFTIVPILCSVIAVIVSLKNYSKDDKKETKEDITDRVKRDTAISTKLDMVITGNTELKNEIKGINNKFDDITTSGFTAKVFKPNSASSTGVNFSYISIGKWK